jgi:hypothetical protein
MWYQATPKAVWAEIAYSLAARLHGEAPTPEDVVAILEAEWIALHQNGIVPQKPLHQGAALCRASGGAALQPEGDD